MSKPTFQFRKEAIQEITTSDYFNQLIQVPSLPAWIGLIGFIAIFLCVILWSIFGSIATQVSGVGILLAENGNIYNASAPLGLSYVSHIHVKPGQYVTKGSVIATLKRPELEKKIEYNQFYLKKYE